LIRGIVSVNAYGIYQNITFPLIFRVFKPKGTLKTGDKYFTKIELALEIITELIEFGFKIDLVLADSLYGESRSFIKRLDKYKLPWIVAMRWRGLAPEGTTHIIDKIQTTGFCQRPTDSLRVEAVWQGYVDARRATLAVGGRFLKPWHNGVFLKKNGKPFTSETFCGLLLFK
jgi:SRSO17 transposase